MARDYKWISKGQELGIDGAIGITGAVTHDSTLTQTGAATFASTVGVTGVLTATGVTTTPTAVSANGTLASSSSVYVFNGADGAVHLPAVASSNGVQFTLSNINGTGTATLTSDATDGAFILVGANGTNTYLVTPDTRVTIVGYAAGTCWV